MLFISLKARNCHVQYIVILFADGALEDPVPVEGGGHQILGQGTLLLTNVAPQDAGVYTCTATSSPATMPVTMEAHLRVLGTVLVL